MKKSKLLSLLLCMAILLSCIVYIPAANVATQAATTTTKAIFIGSTDKTVACAFIPLNIAPASTSYYKLSFKCKWLKDGSSSYQPTKPSIGIIGQNSSQKAGTCPSWAGNYNNNTLATFSNGVYSMVFKLDGGDWNKTGDKYSRGSRAFYLTVGNGAYRNFKNQSDSVSFKNFGCSFIFSDATLYTCDSSGGSVGSTNLMPSWSDSVIDFDGTYYYTSDAGNSSLYPDSPTGSSANKWHVMNLPNHVKKITVPSDYNTSSNYNYNNFSGHDATTYTRKYYTNSNYSDLKFAQLENSDGKGYEVISNDINKKMIIIDANHEGEADSRTVNEYQPTYNKPANLFIPLSLGQYSINWYGGTTATSYLVKVSFNAKRLEGSGYPVLGVISPLNNNKSQAFAKLTKNMNQGSYYSADKNETYTGGDYSYNASTGDFVGWVRMEVYGDSDTYRNVYGANEILTIGNAEHVWEQGKFDTTEFNTSFAISNIKIDLYSCTGSGGSYTVGSLVAQDIGPGLYADNIDVDTPWAYQCNGNAYSSHDRDVARAKQHFWNAEGNVGMVHAVDLSTCMNNKHTLTKHAATANTREYYSCSTCGKNYATPYGLEQITDASAKSQMVYLDYTGNSAENIFYPMRLTGFTGNQYFKFTCKVECFGEGTPVVSTLYAVYNGSNQCETPSVGSNDGDYSVVESSYNSETGILTGYIKAWNATNYNKSSRYPYIRYNPVSGNMFAIVVGNGAYSGNSHVDTAYDTSFAISEPTLYKVNCTGGVSDLATAKSAALLGDNLIAPITDKTVDFDTDYAAGWIASNNPLSAKTGKWYKLGSGKSYITSKDVISGLSNRSYYKGNKMLCISGSSAQNRSLQLLTEIPTGGNRRFTFEIDYRAVGGAEAHFETLMNYDGGNNFTLHNPGYTTAWIYDNGYHYRVVMDTLNQTSKFKLYIGLKYNDYNNGAVYFANAKLYRSGEENVNLLSNGSFSGGFATKIEENFNRKVIDDWKIEHLFDMPYVTAERIPNGFFNNDASANYEKVYDFKGSNTYKPSFGFTADKNTSYRITYDYYCANNRCVNLYMNNYYYNLTLTKNSRINTEDGKFQASYTLTGDPGYADGRGTLSFALNGNDYSSEFSVSNIRIYKLDGSGNPIGGNLAFDLNTILSDADYGVSSVGTKSDFTLGTDNLAATRKDVYGGGVRRWIGNTTKGAAYSRVRKTDGNLFKYYTVDERFDFARAAVLNGESNIVSQSASKFYDPNGDSAIDILDMVLLEYDSINDTDTQFAVANDA